MSPFGARNQMVVTGRESSASARQHAASNACLLGTALCAFVQLADLG